MSDGADGAADDGGHGRAVPDGDSDRDGDPVNVAIACQGGGSHTAFTAGVLTEVLERWDDERFELVGISGTSGGAFNAVAAWYGLLTGGPDAAIEKIDGIWADLATDGVADRMTNEWVKTMSRLEGSGLPIPTLSPYQTWGDEIGKRRIRTILDRYVDFEAVPELCTRGSPELVIGTVDVNAGEFETFTNEAVSPTAVLASCAVPNLFEAVELNGHYHWDGLFSQNPPVDDLMVTPAGRKPDELWVIQINPQRFEGEPTTMDVISDRRNELAGNISLNQELRFVERVNRWIEAGYLPDSEFSHTEVHRIQMSDEYHCSTKLDRTPEFIDELRAMGRKRAGDFLDERA